MDSELFWEVIQGEKRVSGIEAFLILTVAGRIGTETCAGFRAAQRSAQSVWAGSFFCWRNGW